MSIQLVVLKTGEQILCEVEEAGKNKLLLKKPAILVPAGDKGIGLAPWMPYTKASAGVTLRDDAVSFMVEPVDELRNHYTGAFVGGLVVPQQNEIATPKLQLVEG